MPGKFYALKRALFPVKYLKRDVAAMKKTLARQSYEIRCLRSDLRTLRRLVPIDYAAFARLMTPLLAHRARGREKIRVGGARDGGYVMLDDFAGVAAAYSLGIGDDVSWDLEIARKGIPVFQYDHTVEKPPLSHEHFHFHRRMIGTRHQPGEGEARLDDLLRENGHEEQKLILKFDIEGAEWDVIDGLDDSVLRHFSQITCELHDLGRFTEPEWYERAARVVGKLTRHHRLIHVHGNNGAPTFWNGVADFPCVLEASFARASLYDIVESDELFPGALDCPNVAGVPDIPMGHFRFEVPAPAPSTNGAKG